MYHPSSDRSRDVENVLPVFERSTREPDWSAIRRAGGANVSQLYSNTVHLLLSIGWTATRVGAALATQHVFERALEKLDATGLR